MRDLICLSGIGGNHECGTLVLVLIELGCRVGIYMLIGNLWAFFTFVLFLKQSLA